MIVVAWNDTSIGEDYLNPKWFQQKTRKTRVKHEIRHRRRKSYGQCSIKIDGLEVTLDYENENKAFNQKNYCDTGIAKLTFSDREFLIVKKYEWKPEGKDEFQDADVDIRTDDEAGDHLISEAEGNKRVISHLLAERSYYLRVLKLEDTLRKNGEIRCEICELSFEEAYGTLGENFCEVHHSTPLKGGYRESKLNSLHVLCSNCHRMIHRTAKLPSQHKKIMLVPQFLEYLKSSVSNWEKVLSSR